MLVDVSILGTETPGELRMINQLVWTDQRDTILRTLREPSGRMIAAGDADTWDRMISAAIEAEEEAGVLGAVCPTSIGSYEYRKRRANGAAITP